MNTTEAVLNNHLQAAAKADVDQVLDDYADQAVLVTAEGTFRGKTEIRQFFQELFKQFQDLEVSLEKKVIIDDMAYIVWNGKARAYTIPFATDTLIVKNGNIELQTFAAQVEPV